MTDRHAGYLVTLEVDLREDDAAATLAALRQIRGVVAVEPVVGDVHVTIARSRAEHVWINRLFALIEHPEALDNLERKSR